MSALPIRFLYRSGLVLGIGILLAGTHSVADEQHHFDELRTQTDVAIEAQRTSQDLLSIALGAIGGGLLSFGLALLVTALITFNYWKQKV